MNILFSPHQHHLHHRSSQSSDDATQSQPHPLPPPLFIRDKRSSINNGNSTSNIASTASTAAAASSASSSSSSRQHSSSKKVHTRPSTARSSQARTAPVQTQRSLHFSHRITAADAIAATHTSTSHRMPTSVSTTPISHELEIHEEEKMQEYIITPTPSPPPSAARVRPSSSPLHRALSSSSRTAAVVNHSTTASSSLSTSVHRHLRLVWDYLVGQVALANDIAQQCQVNREYRAIRITMEVQRTIEEQEAEEEEKRRVKNIQAKNRGDRLSSKSPHAANAAASDSSNVLQDDRYCIRVSSLRPQRQFLRDIPMEAFHREMQHLVLVRDSHLHGHERRPPSPQHQVASPSSKSAPTSASPSHATYTTAVATPSPSPPHHHSLSGDRVASLLSLIVSSTNAQTSELQRQVDILQRKGIQTIVWN